MCVFMCVAIQGSVGRYASKAKTQHTNRHINCNHELRTRPEIQLSTCKLQFIPRTWPETALRMLGMMISSACKSTSVTRSTCFCMRYVRVGIFYMRESVCMYVRMCVYARDDHHPRNTARFLPTPPNLSKPQHTDLRRPRRRLVVDAQPPVLLPLLQRGADEPVCFSAISGGRSVGFMLVLVCLRRVPLFSSYTHIVHIHIPIHKTHASKTYCPAFSATSSAILQYRFRS